MTDQQTNQQPQDEGVDSARPQGEDKTIEASPELSPDDNDQPGQTEGAPATGGQGAQGAGGPAGFGTSEASVRP